MALTPPPRLSIIVNPGARSRWLGIADASGYASTQHADAENSRPMVAAAAAAASYRSAGKSHGGSA